MLGQTIADPDGIEGRPGSVAGLGLLAVETVLGGDKTTRAVTGRHMRKRRNRSPATRSISAAARGRIARGPSSRLPGGPTAPISADGLVAGTYVHGLFASDGFRRAFLAGLGGRSTASYEAGVEAALDGLAAHLARASRPRRDPRYRASERVIAAASAVSTTRSAQAASIRRIAARMSSGAASARPAGLSQAPSTSSRAVAARPAEREAERAGERGLRPAGVRRFVLWRVAPGRDGSRAGVAAGKRRGRHDQQRGKPRRNEVQEIVEAGGRPAEGLVARRAVADHGIGGVDELVDQEAGQAEEQIPEGRRHNAVGKILGGRFDRGARDARPRRGSKRRGRRFRRPPRGRRRRPPDTKPALDGRDMIDEVFLRKEDRDDDRLDRPSESE